MNMKKLLISGAATVAMLAGTISPALAAVDRVPGAWDTTGSYTVEFTCTSRCGGMYPHTMDITTVDLDAGTFLGTGYYNINNAVSWDVTGNVNDSDIDFAIVYNNINPGYTVNADGTIAPDGTMSGTATGPGQEFTWETTSGNATAMFTDNHGQWVKMSTDKNGAAQSRVGMPTQSKGHTK